jgi:diacylglycerol kinase family enzyme
MELDENLKIIYKIIDMIDKEKETKEDLEYIDDFWTINNMIIGIIPYSREKVDEIKLKYEKEFNYLLNLELTLRNYQRKNIVYTQEQDLLSVRHSLIRVGIKKTLEKRGKEMLKDDLIDNNNSNVYSKFKKILEN